MTTPTTDTAAGAAARPAEQGRRVLEVSDLRVEFDTGEQVWRAVNGVTFGLDAGETLGIVGESGSGKSTTALALMRMLPAPGRVVGGSIRLGDSDTGRELASASEAELRRIRGDRLGMIFQDPMTALNPVMSIGRHLDEALRAHGKGDRRARRERAAELLDLVGIPDPRRRMADYPHQFSGGMRQRAMIAMALANEPDVLLADEPTTALDTTVQDQILRLLDRLNRETGTSIVLITHNMGVVARACSRVLVMYGGRIVEDGPTEQVLTRPRHPYTAGLLAAVPRLDAPSGTRLRSIPGVPPNLSHPVLGCAFAPRCPLAEDRCHAEAPPLIPGANGDRAACWVTTRTPDGVAGPAALAPLPLVEGSVGDGAVVAGSPGSAATGSADNGGSEAVPATGSAADAGTTEAGIAEAGAVESGSVPTGTRPAAVRPGATAVAGADGPAAADPGPEAGAGVAGGAAAGGSAKAARATGRAAAAGADRTPGAPAGGTAPLLEVRGLRKTFPGRGRRGRDVVALDGVDLTLEPGETLGIVGESGCGKSTLARTLVHVHPATAGSIRFRGEDVTAPSPEGMRRLRREVQMVFQDPYASLNPRMTVGEIVAEPLIAFGVTDRAERAKRVESLLERVGLDPDVATRRPRSFSGGQRQRIGIARALAPEPSVLICDEPVSALDVSVQAQVVNLLTDLQRDLGLALVFIAHDLAVVRQVSHRVAVMYLGKVVETGPADEVCGQPSHPYTRALLAAAPVPDPSAWSAQRRPPLSGDAPSPITRPSGCMFHTRCPVGPRADASRTVCTEQEPRLERYGPSSRLTACHFTGELQQLVARVQGKVVPDERKEPATHVSEAGREAGATREAPTGAGDSAEHPGDGSAAAGGAPEDAPGSGTGVAAAPHVGIGAAPGAGTETAPDAGAVAASETGAEASRRDAADAAD